MSSLGVSATFVLNPLAWQEYMDAKARWKEEVRTRLDELVSNNRSDSDEKVKEIWKSLKYISARDLVDILTEEKEGKRYIKERHCKVLSWSCRQLQRSFEKPLLDSAWKLQYYEVSDRDSPKKVYLVGKGTLNHPRLEGLWHHYFLTGVKEVASHCKCIVNHLSPLNPHFNSEFTHLDLGSADGQIEWKFWSADPEEYRSLQARIASARKNISDQLKEREMQLLSSCSFSSRASLRDALYQKNIAVETEIVTARALGQQTKMDVAADLKQVAFDEPNQELVGKVQALFSDDTIQGNSMVFVDARLLELEGGLAQTLEIEGYDVSVHPLARESPPEHPS